MVKAAIAAASLALALLAAAAAESDEPCRLVDQGYGPDGKVTVRVEAVVTGLEVPWGLAFLPGGDLLLTERPGRIRRVAGGRLLAEPVARVPTDAGGEGGLLGLALHPRFAENHLFFVYFTAGKAGGAVNRVERWKLAPDARSAERERLIVDDIPAARFHNGGRLRIGPDGMLYVGTGDGGEPSRAQDRESPGGKLLRFTPEGEIPRDNPFPGSPVWLWGIRNTQGFDWRDGTLVVTDHGPSGELGRSGHDEVNVAAKGANLGWPAIYGCQQRAGMVTPRLTWTRAAPPGGAAFYTGRAIPEWRGSLLIGTLGSRHLHRVVFDGDRVQQHEVYLLGDPPDGYGRLREVIMGPDGHLYVTTSNCDGRGRCPRDGDKVLRIAR